MARSRNKFPKWAGSGKRKDDLRDKSILSVRVRSQESGVRNQGTGIKPQRVGQERVPWPNPDFKWQKEKENVAKMTAIVPNKKQRMEGQ